MILARVIGNVVSTRKEDSLIGFKILMVEEHDPKKPDAEGARMVAVDTLGAGRGDLVLVVRGGAARVISEAHKNAPLDAAIVGIVDSAGI
ncbi:MAG: EutN/CcmL family microcompartment protein [Anaerolineales bacterium]|nr:EutN/CcmL family microcompartment protein [Anaerolineales bacterium]